MAPVINTLGNSATFIASEAIGYGEAVVVHSAEEMQVRKVSTEGGHFDGIALHNVAQGSELSIAMAPAIVPVRLGNRTQDEAPAAGDTLIPTAEGRFSRRQYTPAGEVFMGAKAAEPGDKDAYVQAVIQPMGNTANVATLRSWNNVAAGQIVELRNVASTPNTVALITSAVSPWFGVTLHAAAQDAPVSIALPPSIVNIAIGDQTADTGPTTARQRLRKGVNTGTVSREHAVNDTAGTVYGALSLEAIAKGASGRAYLIPYTSTK